MSELAALIAACSRPATGPPVLATLVGVAGSAYRGAGARLLVLPDDTTVGAISGGCLEKDILAHAELVRASAAPALVSYDLTKDDDKEWGLGLGCNASLEVLLEPLEPGHVPEHLAFVAAAQAAREPAVVATVFRAPDGVSRVGARLLLRGDAAVGGDLGGGELGGSVRTDAERVLREERSDAVTYRLAAGEAAALIEFVPQPVALLVCGDGGDTAPLVAQAAILGWQVRTIGKDDSVGPTDERTAAVIMTHNYPRDLERLAQLLPSLARFVGVLGPKARTERLLAELAARGAAPDPVQQRRLHAPVGLDIGAETPEEVALAIVAEIRAALAGRAGGMLRERKGPIHDRR